MVPPSLFRDPVRHTLRKLGYEIRQVRPSSRADFTPELNDLVDRVGPYTQTSPERVAALVAATDYVVRRGIQGDMVECGVWRGGSAMTVALTLLRLDQADRRLWLYDTFAGMTAPTPEDSDLNGVRMLDLHGDGAQQNGSDVAQGISAAEVRAALESTGYPSELLELVEGPVQDTIPRRAPESIALLRLDTDWYSSTRHELEQLYPRLETGGPLIIDDYGHFQGARLAVDEYFADQPVLLSRIDYTGRIAVKH